MGCCTSSIEINVDDLSPYGFAPRVANSYCAFVDMMARRRHARSIYRIVRRLVQDRNDCTTRLRQMQLDMNVHSESIKAYQSSGQGLLQVATVDELRRIERSSRRILTLRCLADQVIRMLAEENIGTDLLMTLERYTKVPFIQFSRSRLDRVIQNVEKRSSLTARQSADFKSLLDGLDEGEREREEDETEETTSISSTLATLGDDLGDIDLSADLARLRKLETPTTL